MRRTLAVVGAAGACLAVGWWLMNPDRQDRWAVRSEVLDETRHILVRVPDGYVDTARYPLVVLLDGGDQRQHSAEKPLYSRSVAVLAALEKEGLPRMIPVGVENTNRVRDMTPVVRPDLYVGGGGSLAFLTFIETELVPFVEARWHPGAVRILYGESYGGLLVLDALARGRRVFTDYIAVSPAIGVWPDGLNAALQQRMAADARFRAKSGEAGPATSLFIVYGDRDPALVTQYAPSIARLIEDERPPTLRFAMQVVPRAGHNPPESLERALRFVFSVPRSVGSGSNR